VHTKTLFQKLLGLEKTVVEGVRLDDDDVLVVSVRPTAREQLRCPQCRGKCPKYDKGSGTRRWRHLDAATSMTFLEAPAPRVRCPRHGVVVADVPWARSGAGHTRAFDDEVAWLAVKLSNTAVCELMRVAWTTVGSIITRVWADVEAKEDRLDGLSRIGIDEVSYKRGHKYLTVVVDHDRRRLVWAAPGRDSKTLQLFFDALGPERCAKITHVSADQADWIAKTVTWKCPDAVLCADPFHVVQWATDALDEVRREAWREARKSGQTQTRGKGRVYSTGDAKKLRNSCYTLWKNPDNLTERQKAKLEWIVKNNPRLYRAYRLKEGLRYVFTVKGEAGKVALERWLSWARRCRIPVFVHLAKRITLIRDKIHATLDHGLSNALVESTNTKIRLLTRIAYGFKNPQALIAIAMLSLGGHKPTLPGRKETH